MKCTVVCTCSELVGAAELTVPENFKPTLAYELEGKFRIEKRHGTLHPICVSCNNPVMTKGDWSSK